MDGISKYLLFINVLFIVNKTDQYINVNIIHIAI